MIENSVGRTYIGLSDDVGRRLKDHNDGMSKWTKSRGSWRLVWKSHPIVTLGEARKLENLLKRQKGGTGLMGLLKQNGKYCADCS
ncbi:MAG: GIY-YIG nuclease family protein [Opitutaceae bacterium]|nr:GIY-YIG nuclease family protein [Opitutaceae bacterium]